MEPVECSFCAVAFQPDRGSGVAGARVFICRDCVAICVQALAEEDPDWRDKQLETLTKLRDGNTDAQRPY